MIKGFIIGLLMVFSANTFAFESEFAEQGVPDTEIHCLALNMYFEARNQGNEGMLAVAFVTLNRMNSKVYPDTYCGVVTNGYNPFRRDCHFSWFCDGMPDVPLEREAWDQAQTMARWFVYQHEYLEDPTDGADHYHATYVNPWWGKEQFETVAIGDHIFYRLYNL